MLISGKYKAEQHEGMFHDYEVIMTVKETDKSYIFTLESINSRYCANQISILFEKSNHVVIRKACGGHAMCIWSEKDFTLYPFQAGIPYYFKLIQ